MKITEKAKKYLNLRDELKSFEIGLYLYNIEDFNNQMTSIKENVDILETQKVKEDEILNNYQSEKEDLRVKLDSLIEEIEKTQNLGFEGNQRKE